MPISTPPGDLTSPCPSFVLPAVDGKSYRNDDFKDSALLLVVFTCNHCPYAKAVEDRIIALQHELPVNQLRIVAICSNDAASYPDDSFENLRARWQDKHMPFPYLHDDTQAVAKAFGAVCTPDYFLYDRERVLRYRGRLDDNWKEPANVKHREMKDAIDSLLAGKGAPTVQHPSMGCSIKWK